MEALSLSYLGDDVVADDFTRQGRSVVVAASSGHGKSTLAKVIIEQDLARKRKVVVFDADNDYKAYGPAIKDRKALTRFLAERNQTQVARLTGKQLRAEFQGWMETIFAAPTKNGVTIVVDDFAKCVVGELGGNSKAARYASTCAEHLRAKNIWAVWLAQHADQIPEGIIQASQILIVGLHKSRSTYRNVTEPLGELAAQATRLKQGEFIVCPAAVEPFRLTARMPEKERGFKPLIYIDDVLTAGDGDGTQSILNAIQEIPDDVFRLLLVRPEALNLLATLTGISDEKTQAIMNVVESTCAQRHIEVN